MPQIYGHARESNELTPISLSPAESEEERSREMSTEEPTSQMDTGLPVPSRPADHSGEKKKPSLMKKVKAKAKKLKNKLTPGSGHREDESPAHDHDDDSSSSSSDEEDNYTQETGHTPLASTVNRDDDLRTAHASSVPLSDFEYPGSRPKDQSDVNLGAGLGVPHEDRKFGLLDEPAREDSAAPTSTVPVSSSSPLSQFRSAGPSDAEQAVPTSYNYYNKDPSAAYKTPSPEALGIASRGSESGNTYESPSSFGEESAGVSPILAGSRAFGSGISEPGSEDRSRSESLGGVSQPDYSKRSVDRSEEEDRNARIPVGILAPGAVGTDSRSGREGYDDDSLTTRNYNQDVGVATPTSDVKGTLGAVKDAAAEKVGYGSTDEQTPRDTSGTESQKPIHMRAYEGLTGAAAGVGQKLGVYKDNDYPTSEETTSEPTIAQKAYDTVLGTKDAAAEKLSGPTTGESSVGQKAYDTATGTRDATADTVSRSAEGVSGEPTITQKAYGTVLGVKDAAADKLGYNNQSSTTTGTTQEFTGEPPLTQKAYGAVLGAKDAVADKLGYGTNQPSTTTRTTENVTGEPPLTQKAYDTVFGTKDAVADKLGYGTNQPSTTTRTTENVTGEPPLTQKAYETVVGTKDAVADKLGYGTNQPSTTTGTTTNVTGEKPLTQKAYDAVVGTKDAAADKLGYNTNQPGATTGTAREFTGEQTIAQKAYDTILGTKDAVASKLPLGGNTNQQSTEEPVSQRAYDTAVDSKERLADSVSRGTGEPTVTQKAYGTLLGVKDAAADKLGVGSGVSASATSDETRTPTSSFFDSKAAPVSEFNQRSVEQKPVTQKAAETATGWKDSIANTLGVGGTSNQPTSEVGSRGLTAGTEGKPVTEKVTETGGGLLETLANKLGYQGSATRSPTEEATGDVKGRALEAKDIAAENLKQADVAASSDSTPVSQKAADTAYRAKDATVSTLSPTEHDKALSQTVTESISNLPTLLTEKLGFGGNKSATSSPSGTTGTKDFRGASELDVPVSDSTHNLSPAANTPESPASGGIYDRVSGVVSSIFGGNKRTSATGAGEEYSPASSPSGEANREITDTTPMVTDLSGVDTHRSSPAA
ncbi:hypothetical protein R1sor_019960 [Riccia sorocarpa]|uniref:LTI65/LTI78 N-terminal domain-containing protein n=1 Tax=Riccia sorocarpa TaxID=122646 RepID=A0ABD3IE02_9MARC